MWTTPGNGLDVNTSWGPKPALYALGGLFLAVAALWALLTSSQVDRVVAGFFAIVIAVALAAGLMMRTRLTAGPAGLIVAGPMGRSAVRWDQITRIETTARSRLGLSSIALEIDLDDDGLLIFGKTDLGADPEDVAAQLRTLQPPR